MAEREESHIEPANEQGETHEHEKRAHGNACKVRRRLAQDNDLEESDNHDDRRKITE